MSAPDQRLRQLTVRIVAAHQPCSPYTVLGILNRDYGVSTAAANATLLGLIRDGAVSRTFDGRLALPGGHFPTSLWRKLVLAVFLLAFAVFAAWVGYHLVVGSPGGF